MKGPYDSIGAQKSDNSLFLEIANDISNFGSALSIGIATTLKIMAKTLLIQD